MLNPRLLDDISARIAQLAAHTPAKDLERNARALLGGLFGRLDLVTREEFDIQKEILARTRTRLEALESRVRELETRPERPDPA